VTCFINNIYQIHHTLKLKLTLLPHLIWTSSCHLEPTHCVLLYAISTSGTCFVKRDNKSSTSASHTQLYFTADVVANTYILNTTSELN